jgi:4-hydroxy-tetrahydrodipicolinate synthase
VTANVAPRAMANCAWQPWPASAPAIAINNKVFPLHQKLFIEPNPVPVKWALAEMGKMPAGIRLPLVPLAEIATPPCARLARSGRPVLTGLQARTRPVGS